MNRERLAAIALRIIEEAARSGVLDREAVESLGEGIGASSELIEHLFGAEEN